MKIRELCQDYEGCADAQQSDEHPAENGNHKCPKRTVRGPRNSIKAGNKTEDGQGTSDEKFGQSGLHGEDLQDEKKHAPCEPYSETKYFEEGKEHT
ncbi:MAG: hypothetical protein AB7N91_07370 [Candidatus Tectimicrobiota bacterium]